MKNRSDVLKNLKTIKGYFENPNLLDYDNLDNISQILTEIANFMSKDCKKGMEGELTEFTLEEHLNIQEKFVKITQLVSNLEQVENERCTLN